MPGHIYMKFDKYPKHGIMPQHKDNTYLQDSLWLCQPEDQINLMKSLATNCNQLIGQSIMRTFNSSILMSIIAQNNK